MIPPSYPSSVPLSSPPDPMNVKNLLFRVLHEGSYMRSQPRSPIPRLRNRPRTDVRQLNPSRSDDEVISNRENVSAATGGYDSASQLIDNSEHPPTARSVGLRKMDDSHYIEIH